MAAQVYIFPDHIKGDTFQGVGFQVKVNNVDLPIAAVKMELKRAYNASPSLTLSNGSGMTISDITTGLFTVDNQIIDLPAGDYLYDIEITTGSGEVHTYITGTWKILSGVTNG